MAFEEFCTMVRSRDPKAQTETLKALFTRLDTDGDGKISAIAYHKEHLVIDILEELADRRERLAELFNAVDKDHNGTLDASEFCRALRVLQLRSTDGSSDGDLLDVFSALDCDHAGQLDFHQLNRQIHELLRHDHTNRIMAISGRLRSMLADTESEPATPASVVIAAGQDALQQLRYVLDASMARLQKVFVEWDKNGDGLVSRQDFYRAVKVLQINVPKATVDALFDLFDLNKSGYIEYKELYRRLKELPALEFNAAGHVHSSPASGLPPVPRPSFWDEKPEKMTFTDM